MQGNRESGLWVPASAHAGGSYEEDGDEDDVEESEARGREEEREEAA